MHDDDRNDDAPGDGAADNGAPDNDAPDQDDGRSSRVPVSAWLVLSGACLLVCAPIAELLSDAAGVSSEVRTISLVGMLAASMLLMVAGAVVALKSPTDPSK